MNKRISALMFLSLVLIVGCGKKEPKYLPLSSVELTRLHELKHKSQMLSLRRDEYMKEKHRVESLEEDYFHQHIKLAGFSVQKISAFSDGLERACYMGTLKNTGSEIVQKIEVLFKFYSQDQHKEINQWETSFVYANDDFLDSKADAKTKALILAVSGKEYPLKPGESRNLSKSSNCMRESFPNWSADDVEFTVTSVKLRPKMTKFDTLDYIGAMNELATLEARAKANNQS